MKAVKAGLAKALARPDPDIRFYLFYGPDDAGSRALAKQLLIGLGEAEKFAVSGPAVKADPALLADEAGEFGVGPGAEKAMTGKRHESRVVFEQQRAQFVDP